MSGKIFPDQPAGHVFEIDIFDISLAVKYMGTAEFPDRGVESVINDRVRRVRAFPTPQLRPEAEIAVLAEKEEILIVCF